MRTASRVTGALVGAIATLALSGCQSTDPRSAATDGAAGTDGSGQASSPTGEAPGTYGAPVTSSRPEPTAVATDAPVTNAPGEAVPVVVTYSGWEPSTASVEVGAYVQGVVESTGTCTLTLTLEGTTERATVPGSPDASSTSCSGLVLGGSALTSGTWRAVVSYESASWHGSSDPFDVSVP